MAGGKRPRSAPRVLSTQPRIFACSECPARFARNHDLKRHQRGHLSVRPFPCDYCGKSFSRKDALKRHVAVKVSFSCINFFPSLSISYACSWLTETAISIGLRKREAWRR